MAQRQKEKNLKDSQMSFRDKLQAIIDDNQPQKCRIELCVMNDNRKSEFWAYHKSTFVTDTSKTYSVSSKIFLNTLGVSHKKIISEVIHEISHISGYARQMDFGNLIKKLEELNA